MVVITNNRALAISLLACAALLVGACDRPDAEEEEGVSAPSLSPRVSSLEQEVAQLRQEVALLRSEQDKDVSMLAEITRADAEEARMDADDRRSAKAELQRHDRNDEAFRQQIDYLRSQHGLGPMPTK